jgi:cobalamin-dependent methionine synthase I
MLIVGEKINSSIKDVGEAIARRDEAFIEALACNQKLGGADYLEVNSGLRIYPEDEASDMEWLIPVVQKASGLPLCIDTAHGVVLERALKLHKGKAIVNSINGDSERWGEILPLVKQYDCDLVVLPSDRKGIPARVDGRIRIAGRIIEGMAEAGIGQERLYFDPLVLPLSSNTQNGIVFIDTLKELKRCFPETRTISGLSNISFGLPKRSWINQSFLVLSLGAGLDAAIMNPLDKKLMALVGSTEAFLNRDTFCMKYIQAFRSGKLG